MKSVSVVDNGDEEGRCGGEGGERGRAFAGGRGERDKGSLPAAFSGLSLRLALISCRLQICLLPFSAPSLLNFLCDGAVTVSLQSRQPFLQSAVGFLSGPAVPERAACFSNASPHWPMMELPGSSCVKLLLTSSSQPRAQTLFHRRFPRHPALFQILTRLIHYYWGS